MSNHGSSGPISTRTYSLATPTTRFEKHGSAVRFEGWSIAFCSPTVPLLLVVQSTTHIYQDGPAHIRLVLNIRLSDHCATLFAGFLSIAIIPTSPLFSVASLFHLIYHIKTCIYTASWLWLALRWQVHAILTPTPQLAAMQVGIMGSLGLLAVPQHLPPTPRLAALEMGTMGSLGPPAVPQHLPTATMR